MTIHCVRSSDRTRRWRLRVEELKETDRQLISQQNDLEKELEHLCIRANRAEPNEAKLHDRVEQFRHARSSS